MSMISQIVSSTTAGAYKTNSTGKTSSYGRTVGEPKLSEAASEYYKELKEKYSDMDFVLVSSDMKEVAKNNASSFANANKPVVLIDEAKIERMATDEEYRKQYEAIISTAQNQLPALAEQLSATGANVKGFGIEINDNGTASYFAVIDKSLAAQRERIEAKQEAKRAEAKAEAKKEAKERLEEKRAEKRKEAKEADAVSKDLEVVKANSIEELISKVGDYVVNSMSDSVLTEEELLVGQKFDFSV